MKEFICIKCLTVQSRDEMQPASKRKNYPESVCRAVSECKQEKCKSLGFYRVAA